MQKVAVLTVVLLVSVVAAPIVQRVSAQTNPRLGVWKLNLAKSTYQHNAAPKAETRTYTAWQDNGIAVRIETVARDGKTQITTFSMKHDGKEYDYNGAMGDKISGTSTDWRLADAVVTKAGKPVQTTHSVVSQDGKTLTMTTSYPGETRRDVRIYDKMSSSGAAR
jgi:hypothetical protein